MAAPETDKPQSEKTRGQPLLDWFKEKWIECGILLVIVVFIASAFICPNL